MLRTVSFAAIAVRIYPTAFNNYIDLRADIVVNTADCSKHTTLSCPATDLRLSHTLNCKRTVENSHLGTPQPWVPRQGDNYVDVDLSGTNASVIGLIVRSCVCTLGILKPGPTPVLVDRLQINKALVPNTSVLFAQPFNAEKVRVVVLEWRGVGGF